jgi:hypothetical protein
VYTIQPAQEEKAASKKLKTVKMPLTIVNAIQNLAMNKTIAETHNTKPIFAANTFGGLFSLA